MLIEEAEKLYKKLVKELLDKIINEYAFIPASSSLPRPPPIYSLIGPGKFGLNFIVFSLNFSPVRQTLILNLGESMEDVRFEIS